MGLHCNLLKFYCGLLEDRRTLFGTFDLNTKIAIDREVLIQGKRYRHAVRLDQPKLMDYLFYLTVREKAKQRFLLRLSQAHNILNNHFFKLKRELGEQS